eukprot:jgi/Pico_ML_1/52682/g3355.t1
MSASEGGAVASRRFARARSTRSHSVFRRWCIDLFGRDALVDGVVDVAGGQGRLAFELCNADGIDTLVVDPRELRLDKLAKHWDASIRRRRRKQGLDEEATTPLVAPSHCQAFFEPRLWKEEGGEAGQALAQRAWFEAHEPERSVRSTHVQLRKVLGVGCWKCGPRGRGGEAQDPQVEDQHVNGFDGWLQHKAFQCPHERSMRASAPSLRPIPVDVSDARTRIHRCSALLGFHPDQATDAIVQCALDLRKPFCVVPCCVFPQHFPHRRLQDGSVVRTTSQHVAYLVEWGRTRGASFHVSTLDFPGRNRAVHWRPPPT